MTGDEMEGRRISLDSWKSFVCNSLSTSSCDTASPRVYRFILGRKFENPSPRGSSRFTTLPLRRNSTSVRAQTASVNRANVYSVTRFRKLLVYAREEKLSWTARFRFRVQLGTRQRVDYFFLIRDLTREIVKLNVNR